MHVKFTFSYHCRKKIFSLTSACKQKYVVSGSVFRIYFFTSATCFNPLGIANTMCLENRTVNESNFTFGKEIHN